MKKNLLLSLFAGLTVLASNAQVTQINSNRSLEFDYPLTNNKSVYVSRTDSTVWATDGTLAGTIQLSATIKFIGSLGSTVFLNGKLIFAATTLATGAELFITDGTVAGTVLVDDINPGPAGSSPDEDYAPLNGFIYFTADRPAEGRELWRTDGTLAGTTLVKDIIPGPTGSNVAGSYELFSNGSYLLFAARTASSGIELYKSDGTAAGTNLLVDINTGHAGADSSSPRAFYRFNNLVLFVATSSTSGEEVWKTDGTAGGTTILSDINPGPGSSTKYTFQGFSVSFLYTFHTFNNHVFFNATDGTSTGQVWVTDGTTANTSLLKDVVPGTIASISYALLADAVNLSNKFIFPAADRTGRSELWQSDGTPGGTVLFKAFTQTTDNPYPFIFAPYATTDGGMSLTYALFQGNKFFFTANTATEGNELWVTDGVDATAAHTHVVSDINPGIANGKSGDDNSYAYTSQGFYFPANNGTNGLELWKTDGTAGNTSMVADIITGLDSSKPSVNFFLVNNKILFEATNGDDPNETDLYAVDGSFTPLPVKLGDFTVIAKSSDAVVQWQTYQEINTKNFTVQRSFDGQKFLDLGTVAAAGTSDIRHSYSFTDAGVMNSGKDIAYYRLTTIDNDGKSSPSSVIALKIKNASGWSARLMVNPVPENVKVMLTGITQNVQFTVVDITGKKLSTMSLAAVNGQVNIPVANLPRGTYMLVTETGNEKRTVQFVK